VVVSCVAATRNTSNTVDRPDAILGANTSFGMFRNALRDEYQGSVEENRAGL